MKKYLVTGASRGIGQATAFQLASQGHQVLGVFNTGTDSDKDLLPQRNVELVQCNFADRENTLELIESLKDEKFDGFVNSAAIFAETHFTDFDVSAWDKTMEVNVTAPLLIASKVSFNDGASIVNLSSTHGMAGVDCGMAYAASKAVWMNLTQSMMVALQDREIRVNAVAPGWAGDGMQVGEEFLEEIKEHIPLKRIGRYEEVANVISFLLSQNASYINGQTIVVDGGERSANVILSTEDKYFPGS